MITLTKEQNAILTKAKKGDNLFISGGGGVGKSFVVNYIVDALKKAGKTVLITASTGKAATLLGGVTCHRACKIPVKMTWMREPDVDKKAPLYEADTLIIDEISMLRIDAFEYVVQLIEKINDLRRSVEYQSNPKNKHKAPIQLIVVGDFCQLPPVIVRSHDGKPDDATLMSAHYGFDIGNGYAFQAPGWKRCQFVVCELTEVLRQSDKPMIDALNKLRFGDRSGLDYFREHSRKKKFSKESVIHLCGTNKTATEINNAALSRLPGKGKKYEADIVGQVSEQDKQVAPEMLHLKAGAQVIMLQNTEKYHNGSSGIVTALRPDGVTVRMDETDEEVDIAYITWNVERYVVKEVNEKNVVEKEKIGSYSQLPMRLGYAITIHKSQGQTFDKVSLSIGNAMHPEIFACGQLYVSLSRVRSAENLYVDGDLNVVKQLADPEVIKFYEDTFGKRETQQKKQEIPKESVLEVEEDKMDYVVLHCSKQSALIAAAFVNSLPGGIISGTEIHIPVRYKTQAEAFINALP